tara:strand:- start:201 stop:587 length:387 start_codon:yes stop_codon:yes gene_type:complete
MTKLNFIIILVFFISAGFFIRFFIKHQAYENEIIRVNITLKNNCELFDSAFMVASDVEKKTAEFKNGKAVLSLKRSSKIQLEANSKYEGFHYSSIPVKVKEQITLEANCTEQGRLEEIFDSLKKQFKE